MIEVFIERRFKPETLRLIDQANQIIGEYTAQGFTLTLRQLYYQFVARALIANSQTEYKRIGSIINDARLAGLIDWAAIEDRTRNLRETASWNSPHELVNAAAEQYAEDLWRYQKKRVEVWIEKDALLGVIEPACSRWRVPYFACRGYTSQSELYSAGQRLARFSARGQRSIVIHLGDHDPSGIDMSRDNHTRLLMFSGGQMELVRLALNWDQVEQYSPPPNPAKETDSRSTQYRRRFGDESWELDALDPTVIDGLIDAAIRKIVEPKAWRRAVREEEERKTILTAAADRWDDITEFLREQP